MKFPYYTSKCVTVTVYYEKLENGSQCSHAENVWPEHTIALEKHTIDKTAYNRSMAQRRGIAS